MVVVPNYFRSGIIYSLGAFLAGNIEIYVFFCYNSYVVVSYSGNREEVIALSNLTSFLVSIGASIVGYYICKWLDGDNKR